MQSRSWLVFLCDACEQPIKAGAAWRGRAVECPSCGAYTTPGPDAREVHAPEEAGEEVTKTKVVPAPRGNDGGDWDAAPDAGTEDKSAFLSKIATAVPGEAAPLVRVNMKRRKLEAALQAEGDPDPNRPRGTLRHRRHHGRADSEVTFGILKRVLWVGVIGLLGTVCYLGYGIWKKPPPTVLTLDSAAAQDRPLANMVYPDYSEKLEASLERLVKVRDVDQLLAVVRHRQRVEPLIRKFYTRDNPWVMLPGDMRVSSEKTPAVVENFIGIQPTTANSGAEWFLFFERVGGDFLLDWESMVGHSEVPWAEFIEKRVATPTVMRAFMKVGGTTGYYDGRYTQDGWHCYQLTDRNLDHFIYGYTRPGSEADIRIQKVMIQPGSKPGTDRSCFAILRLKYPEEATNHRQVEIVEFIENGWLLKEAGAAPAPTVPAPAAPATLLEPPVLAPVVSPSPSPTAP